MVSYRFVVYDIIEDLKQNFDDAEISEIQVLYWVQLVANRLIYERIKKTNSGMYLTTFYDVTVNKDTKGRKYVDLPQSIFDFPFEKAIDYITYCFDDTDCCEGPNWTMHNFSHTTPSHAQRLYFNAYEKPDGGNVYFYRVGERVYFLGLECINISCVELGLFTALDPSVPCDLDDELPLGPEMVHILKQEVMKLGRFVLMVPTERINDGSDSRDEASGRGMDIETPEMTYPQQQYPQQYYQNPQQEVE